MGRGEKGEIVQTDSTGELLGSRKSEKCGSEINTNKQLDDAFDDETVDQTQNDVMIRRWEQDRKRWDHSISFGRLLIEYAPQICLIEYEKLFEAEVGRTDRIFTGRRCG